ncbi:MAG: AraC family transcriptional regulator [Candidatus Competibacteraceae bacterium]
MTASDATNNCSYSLLQLEGFEPDALIEVIQNGCFQHRLLRGGWFRARHRRQQFGTSIFDWGHYNLPVIVQGAFPANCLTLGAILQSPVPGYINGQPVPAASVQVYTEGLELYYRTPLDVIWTALQIDREQVQTAAMTRLGQPLPIPARGWLNVQPAAQDSARLVATINDALAMASQVSAGPLAAVYMAAVHERLLAASVDAIASGLRLDDRRHERRAPRRMALMRRAQDYLAAHLDQPFSVQTLAQETGLSERMLQYLFREVYGVSPLGWIQAMRLNEVRRDLRHLGPGPGRVAEVAMRWGFMHLGRFSVAYHKLFGERPSDTLRRNRNSH